MSTPNRSRAHRALGMAVAGVVAATPSFGCTEMHPPSTPEDDAATAAPADAAMPVDAMAQADTGPEDFDAGVASDAQAPVDAWAAAEDADAPDAYYYPDGIRG